MTKVKMDVMRPWIATRVTELLGFEDEVLINFIYGLLEGKVQLFCQLFELIRRLGLSNKDPMSANVYPLGIIEKKYQEGPYFN